MGRFLICRRRCEIAAVSPIDWTFCRFTAMPRRMSTWLKTRQRQAAQLRTGHLDTDGPHYRAARSSMNVPQVHCRSTGCRLAALPVGVSQHGNKVGPPFLPNSRDGSQCQSAGNELFELFECKSHFADRLWVGKQKGEGGMFCSAEGRAAVNQEKEAAREAQKAQMTQEHTKGTKGRMPPLFFFFSFSPPERALRRKNRVAMRRGQGTHAGA
jgi:hypothetical protein